MIGALPRWARKGKIAILNVKCPFTWAKGPLRNFLGWTTTSARFLSNLSFVSKEKKCILAIGVADP